MLIQSHGLAFDVPDGWEAEVFTRPADQAGGASRAASGVSPPVAHLANFPLPEGRGDFGSGAVEVMEADDALVCVVEYASAEASTPLYAYEGVPRVDPAQFSPAQMQRPLPGQSGAQVFFHVGDRAFCVYVVLGSHRRRAEIVPVVNEILSSLEIS